MIRKAKIISDEYLANPYRVGAVPSTKMPGQPLLISLVARTSL